MHASLGCRPVLRNAKNKSPLPAHVDRGTWRSASSSRRVLLVMEPAPTAGPPPHVLRPLCLPTPDDPWAEADDAWAVRTLRAQDDPHKAGRGTATTKDYYALDVHVGAQSSNRPRRVRHPTTADPWCEASSPVSQRRGPQTALRVLAANAQQPRTVAVLVYGVGCTPTGMTPARLARDGHGALRRE